MKFIVSTNRLLEALNLAGKCITKNNMLPILNCYLFRIEGDVLEITGSNLEVFLSTKIKIEGDGTGIIAAVPSSRILDLMKELPEQPLRFDIEKKSGALVMALKSDMGDYNLSLSNAFDYPTLKTEREVKFKIDCDEMLSGIRKTLFAVSSDELRPAMTGVLVSFNQNKVTYTGTNASILAAFSFAVNTDSETSFVVPSRVLSILQAIPSGKEIAVELDKKSIVFQLNENTVLSSRLIDDKYPDYKAILPKNNNKLLTIDRGLLLGSLRRITLFTEGKYHKVTLDLTDHGCLLKSENSEGETATETLNHKYTGDPMTIGLDAKSLIACLGKLESEDVNLSFSSPKRAMLLREAGEEQLVDSDLMLLMPLTL